MKHKIWFKKCTATSEWKAKVLKAELSKPFDSKGHARALASANWVMVFVMEKTHFIKAALAGQVD